MLFVLIPRYDDGALSTCSLAVFDVDVPHRNQKASARNEKREFRLWMAGMLVSKESLFDMCKMC